MKKLILLTLTVTSCLSASLNQPRYIRSGEASVLVRPSPINPDIIGDPKPKDTIELINPTGDEKHEKYGDNENKKTHIPGPVRIPAEVVYGDHVSKREIIPHDLKNVKKPQNAQAEKITSHTDQSVTPVAQSSKINKREIKPTDLPTNPRPQTSPAQQPQNLAAHADSAPVPVPTINKREDKPENLPANPRPVSKPAQQPQQLPAYSDSVSNPVPKINKREVKPADHPTNSRPETLPAQQPQNLPAHSDITPTVVKQHKRDIPVPVKPSTQAPPPEERTKETQHTEHSETTNTNKDSEKEPHPATFVRPVPVAQLFNKH